MATGVLTSAATLYYGPSTTDFVSDVSYSSGALFNVLWKEGTWYYVSQLNGARRNYVEARFISVTGAVPTYSAVFSARRVITPSYARFGPTTNYPTNIYLYPNDVVNFLVGRKEDDFALVETVDQATGKYKRVWYEHMKLGTYSGPAYHQYSTGTYNGISLHIIKTHAKNIKLLSLGASSNLVSTSNYGVNGGFYVLSNSRADSIGVQNGVAVATGADVNGTGRGVIYWTGSAVKQKKVERYSEITDIPSTNSWAQGGINMFLGNENWKTLINNDANPYGVDKSYDGGRTGMVANTSTKTVYLIVCTSSPTMTQFRTAIQSYFGISEPTTAADNSTYKGLFLDGGSSTAMQCRNSSGTELEIISNADRMHLQIASLVSKI